MALDGKGAARARAVPGARGTQLTCTYADDNGDMPACIGTIAVDCSEDELSVSAP